MTKTLISSHKQEITIGFDSPFCVIGERINPTGRKLLAAEMAADDYSRVLSDALAQVEAGATMLDVNAGIPMADEPAILAKAIQLVQEVVDVPLAIDSSIVDALEAGLSVYKGKPLVNSVTGEEERLEVVLPLVKKYGAAVVAISNDETGISEDPNVRYGVAKKIVERAADYGILREDVVVAMREPHTQHGGKQAHRHDQDHGQRQRQAFVLCGEHQEHQQHADREDPHGRVAGQDLLIRQIRPLEAHALGQRFMRNAFHCRLCLARREAGGRAAVDVGSGVAVVAHDHVRPEALRHAQQR